MANFYVNIDHVATVREARGTSYPCPLAMALEAEAVGVHGITAHLREDRRHVQDDDIRRLASTCQTPFNFEMSVAEEIVQLAEELAPPQVTLVPERREELTTEGGLDLQTSKQRLLEVTTRLQSRGISVSLFINADRESIDQSQAIGADCVELHTGPYADAEEPDSVARELKALTEGAAHAIERGLIVNAGHGLHYKNTADVAAIAGMNDLNIGHAIVAHAIQTGMRSAIEEMLLLIGAASR